MTLVKTRPITNRRRRALRVISEQPLGIHCAYHAVSSVEARLDYLKFAGACRERSEVFYWLAQQIKRILK